MSGSAGQREGISRDGAPSIDRPMGRRRSDRVVGAARSTQEALDRALAAARSDHPVLVTGPEGSGRKHISRAIHAWSERANGPFLVVSCSAIADALLFREIFGCASAVHASLPEEYPGALGRAGGGTIYLEGVDRLPDRVREALTKALAEGRYAREGDDAERPLRARVIGASTRSCELPPFGKVSTLTLELRPLSERPEDVLPLAAHCLGLYAEEQGVKPIGFTSDARSALLSESWTGNVRELAERVKQAIRLAGNGSITAEALMLAADGDRVPSFKEAKRAFETRYVVGLLRRCGGNISRAARLAKKDRKDFYDVIRRTGVNPADFR